MGHRQFTSFIMFVLGFALPVALNANPAAAQTGKHKPKPNSSKSPSEPKGSKGKDTSGGEEPAASLSGPSVPLLVTCEGDCGAISTAGDIEVERRFVVKLVRTTDTATRVFGIGFATDTGSVFPKATFTDRTGRATVTWKGHADPGETIRILVTAQLDDSAVGATTLTVPVGYATQFSLSPPKKVIDGIRGTAGNVYPDKISFEIAPPDGWNQRNDETANAKNCQAVRVVAKASLKQTAADSSDDTVRAEYHAGAPLARRCVAETRWRFSTVAGSQELKASIVGQETDPRSRASVQSVVHSPGHLVVGFGWPSRGKGRAPADATERTVEPIIGADFSLIPSSRKIWASSLFDHLRFLVATRILDDQLGSEIFSGLQIAPSISPSAENSPLLIGTGVWTGPKHTRTLPFLSLTYDATSVVTSALGLVGIKLSGK